MGTLLRSLSGRLILFVGAMVATTKMYRRLGYLEAFSPLFVGAMVATPCTQTNSPLNITFSPLFFGDQTNG